MRVESKWSPGELVLWLIAAIAATLIVCSRSPETSGPETPPPAPEISAPTGDFDLEFDVVE